MVAKKTKDCRIAAGIGSKTVGCRAVAWMLSEETAEICRMKVDDERMDEDCQTIVGERATGDLANCRMRAITQKRETDE